MAYNDPWLQEPLPREKGAPSPSEIALSERKKRASEWLGEPLDKAELAQRATQQQANPQPAVQKNLLGGVLVRMLDAVTTESEYNGGCIGEYRDGDQGVGYYDSWGCRIDD